MVTDPWDPEYLIVFFNRNSFPGFYHFPVLHKNEPIRFPFHLTSVQGTEVGFTNVFTIPRLNFFMSERPVLPRHSGYRSVNVS